MVIIEAGIKLIVVAGGDGTIEGVMGAMIGSDATLGIIPTGTRKFLELQTQNPVFLKHSLTVGQE